MEEAARPPDGRVLQVAARATEAIGAPSLSFRLKRMESIVGKIKRPGKHYQLGTMDDIGGCRVIVDDMPQLEEAVRAFGRR